MRFAGALPWLAPVAAAAFAPKAWANPGADPGDLWVATIVLGVVSGFLLVLIGSRRRSRWSSAVPLGRLAVTCLGLVLVALGAYGFFRGRPVLPVAEPVHATDAERMTRTIRFGDLREGVDWRWSGVAAAGLGLIAFGAWPRRAAPRRHTRILPPPRSTDGHDVGASTPDRGATAP